MSSLSEEIDVHSRARAVRELVKAEDLARATQPERELQGVCHELLEIIEGQEYIIEDAQFALNYATKSEPDVAALPFTEMIRHMEETKTIAQDLYQNTFNCRRARERAGFEVER